MLPAAPSLATAVDDFDAAVASRLNVAEQFVGLVIAGLVVAGVLLSIIFAAIKTDEDAGDIEQ